MARKTEVTYDDSAAVYEAWIVSEAAREWVGAYDTHAEARAAAERAAA